jgi:hypothetical protein
MVAGMDDYGGCISGGGYDTGLLASPPYDPSSGVVNIVPASVWAEEIGVYSRGKWSSPSPHLTSMAVPEMWGEVLAEGITELNEVLASQTSE